MMACSFFGDNLKPVSVSPFRVSAAELSRVKASSSWLVCSRLRFPAEALVFRTEALLPLMPCF